MGQHSKPAPSDSLNHGSGAGGNATPRTPRATVKQHYSRPISTNTGWFDESKLRLYTNQFPAQSFEYILIHKREFRLYIIFTRDHKETALID